MSLEINEVAGVRLVAGVKEMIQADFVKRRGRSKRRNVTADAGIFRVGPRDHGHRVPANDALDPPLDLDIAGIARLFVGRNRVDVRSICGERERDSPDVGPFLQVDEQFLKSLRSVANQDVVKRLVPFFELIGLDAGHIVGHEALAHETESVCRSHSRKRYRKSGKGGKRAIVQPFYPHGLNSRSFPAAELLAAASSQRL